MKKRMFALLLTAMMASACITGCGGSPSNPGSQNEPESGKTTGEKPVEIWSFLNQEEMNYYKDTYEKLSGGKKVNVTVIPGDQYLTKLQNAFRTGTNAPDICYMEIAHLGQFKDTGMLEDLGGADYTGTEILNDQIPYVAELSKNSKGEISGISWQATPGGFWYKKALAKEYLGTDNPDEISKITSSWDSIVSAGKEVASKSGGSVAFFADVSCVQNVVNSAKGMPWVDKDGNLVSDEVLKNNFSLLKEIRDNGVDAKLTAWQPGWASGMFETDPFIFVGLPSWGLHYVIKANTPKEKYEECKDKWGFVPAPEAYQAGGTWMSMYAKGKNKEAAWEYIKMMTSDSSYLDTYLVDDLGDFPGYRPAIESAIERNHRDPFTGEQDTFQFLYDTAMNVKNDGMSKYDSKAGTIFDAKRDLLLAGELDVDGAVEGFKADMKAAFPEIK